MMPYSKTDPNRESETVLSVIRFDYMKWSTKALTEKHWQVALV